MFNPYEQEAPKVVMHCEYDGEYIYEGQDCYWIEVKGFSHLRFATREKAQLWAFSRGINPDYVSWREATEYYEPEDETYFVAKEESWG